MTSSPEATDHAEPCPGCEICELALELMDERRAHHQTLAERDAAREERDEAIAKPAKVLLTQAWRDRDDQRKRAEAAEAFLTRYRNAQEAADWYIRCLEGVIARRVVRGLGEAQAGHSSARAALDGPKEVAGTHGATEIPGREYE